MATEREILVRLNLRAEQYNRGINQAERATEGFRGKVGQLTRGLGELKGRLGPIGIAAGVTAGAIGAIGVKSIQAANDLGKLKLQIAAVIAANSTITDASGKVLQGVEKIRAAQQASAGLFAELQKDAMKTTATTKELIELMSVALPSALANGLSANQTEKLVVGVSNALKVLNIEADQAKSEMRALFSGDITNDADLAKALQIRKQDIEAAREQGKLYELINGKLADFNAAASIQAQELDGVVSSIQDMGDKLMEIVGQDAYNTLKEGASQLLNEIMGNADATTNLHNNLLSASYEGRQAIDLLAKAVIKVGEGVVWLINLLSQADYTLRSWSINAAETIKGAAAEATDRVVGAVKSLPGGIGTKVLARLGIDPNADRSEAVRYQAKNQRRDLNDLYYGGKDIYNWQADTGAGAGAKVTSKPRAGSGAGTSGRRRAAGGRGTSAASLAKEAQRERERQEQEVLQAMGEAFQHQERVTAAFGGGMAGSIRNMERYLEALKKLPAGYKGAAEEILRIERDLQVERIKATVAAEEKKRDELERTVEAAREAAEAQRAYELQLAQNVADARAMRADFQIEDQLTALDEQREGIERLWARGKVSAQDYYAELQRLRVAELKAQAEANLEQLDAQREALAKQLEQQRKPLDGLVDWAGVAATEGQIAQVDAQMQRVGEKFSQDVARATRENAQAFGDHVSDEVRAGLESAVDAVFTGDLTSISSGLQAAAKKGLVDALMSSDVGQKVGSLFSGAGGWKGALIAGFLDLIIGSFQDLGKAGKINQDNARDLERALAGDDPLMRARDEVDAMRQSLKERRKSTRKFLGIIPIGSQEGFTTADEERQLAALESKKVAEAQTELAERKSQEYQASIDKALAKIGLLRRLGKATTQDLIDELTRVLGTADVTEEKALELQAQLQDLKDEQRQERDAKWDEQLDDQLTFNEVSLQAARNKVAAEMALIDQSTEYGIQRHRQLRRQLQDLDDQLAAEAKQAAEAWADNWEESTRRAADLFEQLADRAEAAFNRIKKSSLDAIADEKSFKDYLSYYGIGSETLNQFEAIGKEIDALKQLLNDTVSRSEPFNRQMYAINERFFGGIRDASGRVIGYPDFSDAANIRGYAETARHQGGVYNRSGTRFSDGDLLEMLNTYRTAMAQWQRLQDELPNIRDDIKDKEQARNDLYGRVRGPIQDLIKDLGFERDTLRYADDPARLKDLKKAQIDEEYRRRVKALENSGALTSIVDPGDRQAILDRLRDIRDFEKQALDQQKEDAAKFTDSNPLPVRVVELPPAFALPSSYYFRAATSPSLRLEPGAIQINGSGLSDSQLAAAVQQALVNAGSDLTRVVNRQNAIGSAVVRLN